MATPCRAARAFLLILPLLLASTLACESPPAGPSDPVDEFSGSIDPGQSSAVLKRLVGAERVALELVAVGPVRVDPDNDRVALDVAVRNVGNTAIPSPLAIRLGRFHPNTVYPANADWPSPCLSCEDPTFDPEFPYAYLYDDEFGNAGELAPGQTSAAREWSFEDPGLVPFSFGASARLLTDPETPVISGQVFVDANGNGEFDDNELPFGGGVVSWADDDAIMLAPVGPDGRYRMLVSSPGLYQLTFDPLTDGPGCTTTPNPLQVVVVPGPDGSPVSYDGADFGWSFICGPDHPDVILTPRPLEEFRGDRYDLIGVEADGRTLITKVGYSGCSGGHPLTLVISSHIMESFPPQTTAILAHDGRGEKCEAYFEERRRFYPRELLALTGVPVVIRLQDFEGNEHRILMGRQDGIPVLTDRPLQEFRRDHYFLGDISTQGDVLTARVGFSGCSGGHPLELVVSSDIIETNPPQTDAVLSHDSLGELCAAFFEEDRSYDFSAFFTDYGRPILLRIQDWDGVEHSILVGDLKDDG